MVRLRSRKRSAGVAFAFAAAVLALAVGAWARPDGTSQAAATLRGTAKPDVLRGTGGNDILEGLDGADRLYGGAGQDRLYGGAGNDFLAGGPGDDVLSGGPGADVFRCGSGRDVVYADASDSVAKDCEVVHRGPAPLPAGALARPGAYRGGNVRFQVQGDGRTIAGLRVDWAGDCPPLGRSQISVADSGPWAIDQNHAFAIDEGDSDPTHLALTGAFAGDAASGTFDIHLKTAGGECDTGAIPWSAAHR
ncbi:MAG TPA: hypothetical protein VF025_07745 [Gaiellaceae bacterium]